MTPAGNQIGRTKMSTKISLDVVNFKKELQRIEEEINGLANLEIAARITYATDQLRVVTPVDTGEARSGWYSQINKEIDGTDGGIIINEVEHISNLNAGSSKQAPRNFIEQVLIKIGLLTPN